MYLIKLIKVEYGSVHEWFTYYVSHMKRLPMLVAYVPQGSKLGPLLFFLYIIDFPNISSSIVLHLVVYDTNYSILLLKL